MYALRTCDFQRLSHDGGRTLQNGGRACGVQAGKSSAPSRTSESCYLSKETYRWLHERVEALTGKPPATHEPPQVARYVKDQFYLAHFDAFDMSSESGRECAAIGTYTATLLLLCAPCRCAPTCALTRCFHAAGGQRVATVLIYLNTVPEGGGTFFPTIQKRFLPEQGTAVVFFPATIGM